MELLQLKYFLTTARHGNMTRAAKELYISQPALSKMIKSLENELGVPLFDRKGKHIVLNAFGEKFLKRASQALSALEQGVAEITEMSKENVEIISLYVAVGSMLLPWIVRRFRDKYPHIRFNLIQHPGKTGKALTYDFAITSEPLEHNEHVILLEEEIMLGVPRQHHLSSRNEVTLLELQHEKFISLTTGNPLRRTTDRFFADLPFSPDIIFESDDPATVRGLIESGLGISFIPSILWSGLLTEDIKLLPIRGHRCIRTIYLSWPTKEEPTGLELSFLVFIQQLFKELLPIDKLSY